MSLLVVPALTQAQAKSKPNAQARSAPPRQPAAVDNPVKVVALIDKRPGVDADIMIVMVGDNVVAVKNGVVVDVMWRVFP